MSDSEMSKELLIVIQNGKKEQEYPKQDGFMLWIMIMRKADVRNWRMKAKDKDGWGRILEEAKTHLEGCDATDDDDDNNDVKTAKFVTPYIFVGRY
jgi:hypothetical protein